MLRIKAQYSDADSYNGDESGFIPSVPPDATLCSEQMSGKKKSKKQITAYFICNASGTDKCELVFIGKAKKPQYFKKKTLQSLGFYYRNNKKAWMTCIIFEE